MKFVSWSEFWKIVKPGLILTCIVAGFWALILGWHWAKVTEWNNDVGFNQNQYEESEWRTNLRQATLYNAALRFYQSPNPEHTRQLRNALKDVQDADRAYRYVEFVSRFERATTSEQRMALYLRYLERDTLPDTTTIGAEQALTRTDGPLAFRVLQLIPSGSSEDMVDRATHHHWQGRYVLTELPTRPQPVWRSVTRAELKDLVWTWVMVSWFVMGVVYGVSLISNIERWSLPANLGGWLLMLLYAPSFLIPWGVRLIYVVLKHIVVIPVAWLVAKGSWLLFEVDLTEIASYASQRRRANQKAERERLEEAARIGQDVLDLRLQLVRARAITDKLPDPAARHRRMVMIESAEEQLKRVGARRTSSHSATDASTESVLSDDDLEDIVSQVDALHEAEHIV